MPVASDSSIPSPFRGEPGEPSPDAIGGWSADDMREYSEYALRSEIQMFVKLYGVDAALALVMSTVGSSDDADPQGEAQ